MIIKICGIQSEDTLICCDKNKINFFGMIFYSKSPRNISIRRASILQNLAKDLNINGVGVFVDKILFEIERKYQRNRFKIYSIAWIKRYNYIKTLKKNWSKNN
jgi:Phosphoribosylanthranilate isomerase